MKARHKKKNPVQMNVTEVKKYSLHKKSFQELESTYSFHEVPNAEHLDRPREGKDIIDKK